jgi:hypothetical protein
MLMPNDPRAVYSDGLDILCNQAGVTLHFTQESSKSNQPHSISKVGMSYEQAERVYQALQYALIKAQYLKGPKGLPPTISPDK